MMMLSNDDVSDEYLSNENIVVENERNENENVKVNCLMNKLLKIFYYFFLSM